MSVAGESTVDHRQRNALRSVCGVLFLTFLDTTIVSVALASIQGDLHAGVAELQWVVNAYALVFASLMLTAGTLSDRFGRKRLMMLGLGLFGVGSLLALSAPNVSVLIAGRAIMGAGAAASEPGTLSVIRQVFPDHQARARALGSWAAVSGLALALGPVLGGALTGIGTWRAVFVFNVVATVAAALATARYVPESSDPIDARLDFGGFAFALITLGATSFAVISGETDGYRSGPVLALFVVAGLGAIAFVVNEQRFAHPMLDLSYLRTPAFTGALVVVFAAFFAIFSIFFFTALYLQVVSGYSGYKTALEFLPMAAAIVVASLVAGRWVARVGPRIPMAAGCCAAGIGILLSDTCIGTTVNASGLAAALALSGLGFGTVVVPATSVPLSVVPQEHSGMASSVTNTSRELGALFGVAILGALVNAHLTLDLSRRLRVLGVPREFQAVVITAVETGGVPAGGKDAAASRSFGPIVAKVIHAAYGAFASGLDVALLASGAALLAAGLVAVATLRAKPPGFDVARGDPPPLSVPGRSPTTR